MTGSGIKLEREVSTKAVEDSLNNNFTIETQELSAIMVFATMLLSLLETEPS